MVSRSYKVTLPLVLLISLILSSWDTVHAASPKLSVIQPKGGQRGGEVEVTIKGARLHDAQQMLFYDTGVRFNRLEVVGDKGTQVKAVVNIAEDCRLGEHAFRLRTATGLSELHTFFVGPFPGSNEVEPNSEFDSPQDVPINVTVSGVVQNEDVDYFRIKAKKGQRITAEIEAVRLGVTLFDPYVAIMDTNRFELAASDDTALLLQDSVASVIAPNDGSYIVQVRETSYGGSDRCVYRLHVGTFCRPLAAFPPGGRMGEELTLRFLGDVGGEITKKIKLPEKSQQLGVFPVEGPDMPPSPNWIRISPFPNLLESEPNNQRAQATSSQSDLPLALNGIISSGDDEDWFKFQAKKNQSFDIHAYARRLRSPLDPVIQIFGPDGKSVAKNDDARGVDSYVRFKAPSDGAYTIGIWDHLRKGGETYTYRIEISPVRPTLTLNMPVFKRDTQDQQTVVVPRGNRYGTIITAKRNDFRGDLAVSVGDLPEGVQVKAPLMAASMDKIPVIFEATPDAAIGGRLVPVMGKHTDEAKNISGAFAHNVDLVIANPNNTVYYRTQVDKMAFAVAEETPFKIELVPPKVPVIQGGAMSLKVVAHRREGFDAPIKLKMLVNPPGITSAAEITMPKGQNTAFYGINANPGAQLQKWQIAVAGMANVKGGETWVSSDLVDLEVSPPFVVGQLEMTAVERGKTADVVCVLEQKKPFEGKARLKLLGLPAGATTQEQLITKDSKEVVFNVTTGEKSPTGQHKSLFCSLDVEQNGEVMRYSIGGIGTLRIDPPPKKDLAAPVKKPPVKEAKKAPSPKRLSRLEQLRQEQAERAKTAMLEGGS